MVAYVVCSLCGGKEPVNLRGTSVCDDCYNMRNWIDDQFSQSRPAESRATRKAMFKAYVKHKKDAREAKYGVRNFK
jgi:hypothetical protein